MWCISVYSLNIKRKKKISFRMYMSILCVYIYGCICIYIFGYMSIYAYANFLLESEAFSTLAHAWWFTVITIPTIGYGDIVPSQSSSKIVVCFLGFLAYCTFVAASTQISVGLTLMMEEKKHHHLCSCKFKTSKGILHAIAKRMNRNRQLTSKFLEKVKR
ncbi:unnamed protein product [Angiostrongylus costaricensis]|uniref:Ion_trans_2 domain-containing protein n=1 Tax=Angiostrongylus costaricensis TaxID=334426 RepID=A0A158PMJ7_ANGCS|nr:unnamed protein product [Angiostrongylus costaricensis]